MRARASIDASFASPPAGAGHVSARATDEARATIVTA
jgi:hypothetical protein